MRTSEYPVTDALLAAAWTCERACARLGDTLLTASEVVITARTAGAQEVGHVVLDSWYLVSAASRLLGHFEDHNPAVVLLVVEACAHEAGRCAAICEASGSSSIADCALVCRDCVAACAALLDAAANAPDLEPGVVAQIVA